MLHDWTLTAVTCWTVLLAVIVAAVIAAWACALHLLPPSRRNTILKIVSLCWLAIPSGVIFVWAAHDVLARDIAFHAAVFGNTPESSKISEKLLAQPQWVIGPHLIGYIPTYALFAFGLLPTLAISWVPKDRVTKSVRLAMEWTLVLFMLCLLLRHAILALLA